MGRPYIERGQPRRVPCRDGIAAQADGARGRPVDAVGGEKAHLARRHPPIHP